LDQNGFVTIPSRPEPALMERFHVNLIADNFRVVEGFPRLNLHLPSRQTIENIPIAQRGESKTPKTFGAGNGTCRTR
jgi:hypothetical protein